MPFNSLYLAHADRIAPNWDLVEGKEHDNYELIQKIFGQKYPTSILLTIYYPEKA